MAGSLNKVMLIGNVGKDPEIRSTRGGNKIANFSIATSDTWKDKNSGEKKEKTEWHRIVVFNENLAKIVEKYVKKGSKVYVEGTLQTRKWTDEKKIERYSTEITIQGFGGSITLLDSKRDDRDDSDGDDDDAPPSSDRANGNGSKQSYPDDMDDEIPFSWIFVVLAAAPLILRLSGYA